MDTPFQVNLSRLRVPVHAGDHVQGPRTAPVTVVWYADFQCPHCAMAYRNLTEVLRQRAAAIRLIFRHFPVTDTHPYAEPAARAAEVAAGSGRFWEMYDWLFTHQDQLDPARLSSGAAEIGLPAGEVHTAQVDAGRTADRVRQDIIGGMRSGVTGTPAFFINGVRHDGRYGVADLLAAVDAARDQAAEGAALRGSARGSARDQADEDTSLRPAALAAVRDRAAAQHEQTAAQPGRAEQAVQYDRAEQATQRDRAEQAAAQHEQTARPGQAERERVAEPWSEQA